MAVKKVIPKGKYGSSQKMMMKEAPETKRMLAGNMMGMPMSGGAAAAMASMDHEKKEMAKKAGKRVIRRRRLIA